MKGVFLPIFIAILLVASGGGAASGETKQYTHPLGVEYTVTFSEETNRISVAVNNPTEKELPAHFRVRMDTRYSEGEEFVVLPGKERVFSYNLTTGVDVMRDNHSVQFTAGPKSMWFNFTKDIDPKTTKKYPTPEITDISLETRSHQNEMRTIINVSAYNPSGRSMTLVIRAHTLETTGFYGLIQFSPYSSSSETIILNEQPGELVVGEVRMYTGNFSEGEGGFDQVEIKGRSDGTVEWTHEEYVPVVPSWEDEDDYYVYENESVHREKVGAPETLKESPAAWIAGVLVLLFGFRGFRKYRS